MKRSQEFGVRSLESGVWSAANARSPDSKLLTPALLAFILAALLGLAGCGNTGSGQLKVIVGATLLTGSGEVPDSVVVIDGKRIRAVGPRPTTPIPQDSERIDGMGRFVKAEAPVAELAAGQAADLALLDKDRKVERRMVDGTWSE